MQFNNCEILRDRELAVLVWFAKVRRSDWVPKSALMPGSIYCVRETGLLIIQDWKGRKLIETRTRGTDLYRCLSRRLCGRSSDRPSRRLCSCYPRVVEAHLEPARSCGSARGFPQAG